MSTYKSAVMTKKPQKAVGKNTPFLMNAFRRIRPNKIITEMMRGDDRYKYYRDVLFEAFSAWVIVPDKNQMRRDVILQRISVVISAHERKYVLNDKSEEIAAGDSYLRSFSLGEDFLREMYYGVGGIEAFQSAISREEYINYLDSDYRLSVLSIIKLVGVFHYRILEIGDHNEYNPVSLNSGYEVVREIGNIKRADPQNGGTKKVFLKVNSLENYISLKPVTMCFLYAADGLMVNSERTLLEFLFDPRIKISNRNEVFKMWLARARYTRDNILQPIGSSKLAKADGFKFGDVEAAEIPIPEFTEDEVKAIHDVFRKKRFKKQDG